MNSIEDLEDYIVHEYMERVVAESDEENEVVEPRCTITEAIAGIEALILHEEYEAEGKRENIVFLQRYLKDLQV